MVESSIEEISLLIGGKAGFGIDRSGAVIGRLLNRLGYRVYIYRDYPSLIRGGHTFSIIRASRKRIAAHRDKVDFILALNQETFDLHKSKLKQDCFFIFDADAVKTAAAQACGLGLSLGKLLKEEQAPEIMRNTCIIGALVKALGIEFSLLEEVLKKEITKDTDLNLKVARRGFNEAKELIKLKVLEQKSLPLFTGNQAIALGLLKNGLKAYLAYPMTPTSPILHYLAAVADDFALEVIHPESEIGVILMALGYAYAGKPAAVGTSGGGFCLMTEGLSFAGMAELPLVIVLGQRPGPSTGLPTYSAQSELYFALYAGQGEFVRFLVAPGDNEEAYYWSALSLQISWKYRIPSIILSDKNLGEGSFNFDLNAVDNLPEENRNLEFASVPRKGEVIKVNSYEHNQSGITTEDPQLTAAMQKKRLDKEKLLAEELERFKAVNIFGSKSSQTALLCWGSNKGVSVEVGEKLGLKVIQPIVLNPFPLKQFTQALSGVKHLICIENNATGQLANLVHCYGFEVNTRILKYDGRPFSVEELETKVSEELR